MGPLQMLYLDVMLAFLQVDPRDQWELTPLHLAAQGGHAEAIQLLLDLKHPLLVVDKNGTASFLTLYVAELVTTHS
jgi:hypothetical protein